MANATSPSGTTHLVELHIITNPSPAWILRWPGRGQRCHVGHAIRPKESIKLTLWSCFDGNFQSHHIFFTCMASSTKMVSVLQVAHTYGSATINFPNVARLGKEQSSFQFIFSWRSKVETWSDIISTCGTILNIVVVPFTCPIDVHFIVISTYRCHRPTVRFRGPPRPSYNWWAGRPP